MFWIIQEDLSPGYEQATVLDILHRFGIPNQPVKVTNWQVLPEVTHSGNIITNGSIRLSQIAARRGWTPGGFQNENFSYEVWRTPYQACLLNRNAVVTTIADADPAWNEFFMRPVLDDKGFNGRVISLAAFKDWQARHKEFPDIRILMAPVKHIGQEHRHFIVDGTVVSSSRYKLGGCLNQSDIVDRSVVAYAERMAHYWQPARAFVLDTYVTGDEIGIVEVGGICAAGFYQADIQKIIMALDAMRY